MPIPTSEPTTAVEKVDRVADLPHRLAIGARDEDADCIACSMMSNSHLVLVPMLIDECGKVGRPDMAVNLGGIIPQEDVQSMLDAGVRPAPGTRPPSWPAESACTTPACRIQRHHPGARSAWSG
jgi:methylmalonyl-CoA mutase cobalamin-binding domain/chain